MWSVAARSVGIGRTPGGKPRRVGHGHPRRKPRKLTTSQAAIRRFEARKRGGTGRTRSKPLPGRGPEYTGRGGTKIGRGPKTRGVNTGSRGRPVGRGRRPTSTTSQAAIARSRSRLGRGRVAGRPLRGPRRR
jgi:hypothetical protein